MAVGGWWRLAVDGPLGRSLRAVLNKKKPRSHRATASCISSRPAAPSRRRPSGCLGASGAGSGRRDPGHRRGTGSRCGLAVGCSTSGMLGLGLRGGCSPRRQRCGCRSAAGHGSVHIGPALAFAGVPSGPACHRVGRLVTRGAQYDGVPHVGITTQVGPLAATVPSADIGWGRGGVRPVGATGPKRAERPELVRVDRPDFDAKSRRGPGYVVGQEEFPPRGRAGVPVGLRLVVPSPSHRDAGDGGSERPHGRSSSTSPGMPSHGFPSRGSQQAISALRLAEKLGCIPPTVRPVHWLMARGAATTTAAPRPTQVWAELVTLRLMARNIRTTLDWFCLGLAVISFATLLRVGEAASVRPVDIRTRCTLGFFDDKKDDDWATVRLGAWPDAWRAAMAAHPWVSSRPASVPLMAAAFDLQAAIHDASQRPRLLAHGGAPDEVPGQCPRCVQLGPVRREPAHIPEDRGPTLHGTRGPPPDGQREGLLHVIAPP